MITPELQELLRLYAEEQECSPAEQAVRAEAFKNKVKEVSEKMRLHHWEVSAYVRKQHEKQRLSDERRLGRSRASGSTPSGES